MRADSSPGSSAASSPMRRQSPAPRHVERPLVPLACRFLHGPGASPAAPQRRRSRGPVPRSAPAGAPLARLEKWCLPSPQRVAAGERSRGPTTPMQRRPRPSTRSAPASAACAAVMVGRNAQLRSAASCAAADRASSSPIDVGSPSRRPSPDTSSTTQAGPWRWSRGENSRATSTIALVGARGTEAGEEAGRISGF